MSAVGPAHRAQEQDHTGRTAHNSLIEVGSIRCHLNRGSLFIPLGLKSTTHSDARVKLSNVSPWSSQWRRARFKSRRETGTPFSSAHPSLLFDHSCCSGWFLRCSATVSQLTVLLTLYLSLFPLIHTVTAAVHSTARPTQRNKSRLSLAVS